MSVFVNVIILSPILLLPCWIGCLWILRPVQQCSDAGLRLRKLAWKTLILTLIFMLLLMSKAVGRGMLHYVEPPQSRTHLQFDQADAFVVLGAGLIPKAIEWHDLGL